jgi:hypothetical protein
MFLMCALGVFITLIGGMYDTLTSDIQCTVNTAVLGTNSLLVTSYCN